MSRGALAFTAPAPISEGLDFSSFDCGNAALNDWLRSRATASEGLSARAYVVMQGAVVASYYCIATGAVAHAAAPGRLRRNMPDPIPVMVIGRLAVDRRYQGKGLGQGMLKDALQRILGVSRMAGVRAVLVHAIDDAAAGFYAAYGFRPFAAGERTLFLSVGEIAAVLG